jgi:hypothetical protein
VTANTFFRIIPNKKKAKVATEESKGEDTEMNIEDNNED